MLTLLSFLLTPIWSGQSANRLALLAVEIQGVDVSHYQDVIDWDTVAAKQPLRFAFVKATEGSGYTDSLFCHNWDALKRLHIRRGAYHYFRASGCGYEQALNFLQSVEMQPGDMVPVLDIETTDGMPEEIMLEETRVWLQTVEKSLGVKPILYTNQHFYERNLAGQFDDYPLWVARYSDERPAINNGRQWDIWQYSNKGCIDGISKRVDLDIFAGTNAMFDRLCWFPADPVQTVSQGSVAP